MRKLSETVIFILTVLSFCSSAAAGGKVLLVHSYYGSKLLLRTYSIVSIGFERLIREEIFQAAA